MSSYLINCCNCGNVIYEEPVKCYCIFKRDNGEIADGCFCETCRKDIINRNGLQKVECTFARERYSKPTFSTEGGLRKYGRSDKD